MKTQLTKPCFALLLIISMLFSGLPSGTASAASKPTLNKRLLTLVPQKSSTLKVKNNKATVTWFSKNKKIATVSTKGKVTAKKTGKTTIIAKIGKTKLICNVTVKNPTIHLNKKTLLLTIGKPYTLKLKNNSKKVTWSSKDKKIATVSAKCLC